MRAILYLALGLIFLFPDSLSGQNYLSLENPGRFKRIKLFPGTTFQFRYLDAPYDYEIRLDSLSWDWIYTEGDSIALEDISRISLPRSARFRQRLSVASSNMLLGGIFFPLIVLLNHDHSQSGWRGPIILSAAVAVPLFLGSYLLVKLGQRHFRIGRRWALLVRD